METKIGDKSTCSMCKKPIEYVGPYWRHIYGQPRHPGVPKGKGMDVLEGKRVVIERINWYEIVVQTDDGKRYKIEPVLTDTEEDTSADLHMWEIND